MTLKTILGKSVGLGLPLLWFTTGCHSLPHCNPEAKEKAPASLVKSVESQYVIEVNGNGLLYDLRPGAGHRLIKGATAVTNYLEQTIWAGFKQSGKTNILLFIHGGLNARDQGLAHYLGHYEAILN